MARMPCRPRVASLILCVTGLSAVTLLSGMPFASSAVAAESPPPTPRVEPEVRAADPFVITPERWLVSHRGGPRRFPEEGMRGYDASAASGFALEADARQLGDGTWVLLHDATVDRTMTGVTGAVDGLTLAQWQTARLRPAPSGRYPDDPAVTVVDFLQRQAGKVPIVLELKAGDADGFVETVRAAAGAELPSVMVQSFDFAVAQRFGDAGLTPMFLMGAQIYPTVETIIGAGIRYVGVARSMDAASVAQLRAAGLVVVSYTVNTGVDLDIEFREGVHGVFTDDPWRMAVEGALHPGVGHELEGAAAGGHEFGGHGFADRGCDDGTGHAVDDRGLGAGRDGPHHAHHDHRGATGEGDHRDRIGALGAVDAACPQRTGRSLGHGRGSRAGGPDPAHGHGLGEY